MILKMEEGRGVTHKSSVFPLQLFSINNGATAFLVEDL